MAKLHEIEQNPDGLFPAVGASRRYPLSTYFKHRYKGRLDGLICDELHEYNNDSARAMLWASSTIRRRKSSA